MTSRSDSSAANHRYVEHEKKPLVKAVILTPTRTIGFARQPVQDDVLPAGVSLPTTGDRYSLGRDSTYIDAKRGRHGR